MGMSDKDIEIKWLILFLKDRVQRPFWYTGKNKSDHWVYFLWRDRIVVNRRITL
jgi:hypothetical protein